MGFTYKLKDEVLHYIVERKTKDTKLSCQDISNEIQARFSLKISKSSIHEALKAAGIIKPKERKIKDTFALPQEVRVKISTDMAKVAPDLLPAQPVLTPTPIPPPETALSLIPDITQQQSEPKPVENVEETIIVNMPREEKPQDLPNATPVRGLIQPQAGHILLKAVLWEMGLGLPEAFDKALRDPYYTHLISAYRLEFKEGVNFFVDAQFTDLATSFETLKAKPRFLPRATMEACDHFVCGYKPLLMNDLCDKVLIEQLQSQLKVPQSLSKVGLINTKGEEVVCFNDCLAKDRAVDVLACKGWVNFNRIKESIVVGSTIEAMAYDIFAMGLTEDQFIQIVSCEGFTLKSPTINTLNLIIPDNFEQSALVMDMCAQLTSLRMTLGEELPLTVACLAAKEV